MFPISPSVSASVFSDCSHLGQDYLLCSAFSIQEYKSLFGLLEFIEIQIISNNSKCATVNGLCACVQVHVFA